MTTTHCPQSQSPLTSMALAANDPAIPAAQRQGLVLPTPPSPQQSGGLGCVTLVLSFSLAVAASVIIGGVAELTIGTNFSAQGLKVGATGIYTGVATFIVGISGVCLATSPQQHRTQKQTGGVAPTKTTLRKRILLPAVSIPRVTPFAVRQ